MKLLLFCVDWKFNLLSRGKNTDLYVENRTLKSMFGLKTPKVAQRCENLHN
jgi:hypothetical protein